MIQEQDQFLLGGFRGLISARVVWYFSNCSLVRMVLSSSSFLLPRLSFFQSQICDLLASIPWPCCHIFRKSPKSWPSYPHPNQWILQVSLPFRHDWEGCLQGPLSLLWASPFKPRTSIKVSMKFLIVQSIYI